MPAGRPSGYSLEIAEKICDAVASSQDGVRKLLNSDPELPSFQTVNSWLSGRGLSAENHAQFVDLFARAKRRQLEAMADDIVDISRDERLEPNDKRVRVDTLKWLLSKLIPKVYGDRIDVTSGGEKLAVPTHQIDARVQSIIMQARARKLGALGETPQLDDNALKLLE